MKILGDRLLDVGPPAWRGVREQARNRKPKQAGSFIPPAEKRVMNQLHEAARSVFVGRLDQHSANRVNPERFFVPLLFLDEVVVGAEFLQHIRSVHGAPIGFVEEMSLTRLLLACGELQREQRVGLDREPFRFVALLPEILVTLPR